MQRSIPIPPFPSFTFDLPTLAGRHRNSLRKLLCRQSSRSEPVTISSRSRRRPISVGPIRPSLPETELIKLQQEAGFGAGALQHLGTFSRERNAPTWRAGTASITQRFYIGHLNLVKPNPPAARHADIQKYFGLRWVNGTAGHGFPANPRRPGSLAIPGIVRNRDAKSYSWFHDRSRSFSNFLNYAINRTNGDDPAHILATLSLGAALIDQYDDDTARDPLTGTTTTMIEYAGGWAVGLENTDPARPKPVTPPLFRHRPACRPPLLLRSPPT